jgi:DNA-binding NarL/FixJ family response regulator
VISEVAESKQVRVYLVVRHETLRRHICNALAANDTLYVLPGSDTAVQDMAAILTLRPDVVLVDLQLADCRGIQVIEFVRSEGFDGEIVALAAEDSTSTLFDALVAGATGYLLKREFSFANLASIVECVAGDSTAQTPGIKRRVVSFFHSPKPPAATLPHETISPREREILSLLERGYSSKEVSRILNVSYETVRTHKRNLFRKLEVKSVTEAIAARRLAG